MGACCNGKSGGHTSPEGQAKSGRAKIQTNGYLEVESNFHEESVSLSASRIVDEDISAASNDSSRGRSKSESQAIFKAWREAVLDGDVALISYYAGESPNLDLANHIFPKNKLSSLAVAITQRRNAAAMALVESGADINWTNQHGDSILHLAVKIEATALITMLLGRSDLKIHHKNSQGLSPLDLAMAIGSPDMCELLDAQTIKHLRKGGDPSLIGDLVDESEEDDGFDIAYMPDDGLAGVVVATKETYGDEDASKLPGDLGFSAMAFSRAQSDMAGDDIKSTSSVPALQTKLSVHNRSQTTHLSLVASAAFTTPDNKPNLSGKGSQVLPPSLPGQQSLDLATSRSFIEDIKKSSQFTANTTSANPFNQRIKKRRGTKLVIEQMKSIAAKEARLPDIRGWIMKKQPHAPYSWQRRWVVCKGRYLLWSEKQRELVDETSASERSKFNKCISLTSIKQLGLLKTKDQCCFFFTAIDPSKKKRKPRRFEWKCQDRESRDFFVKGILKHKRFVQETIKFLEKTS